MSVFRPQRGPFAREPQRAAFRDRGPGPAGPLGDDDRIDHGHDLHRAAGRWCRCPAGPGRHDEWQSACHLLCHAHGIKDEQRIAPIDNVADVEGVGACGAVAVSVVRDEHQRFLPGRRPREGDAATIGPGARADEQIAGPQCRRAGVVDVERCPDTATAPCGPVETDAAPEGLHAVAQWKHQFGPRVHAEAPPGRWPRHIERPALHVAVGLPCPARAEGRPLRHLGRSDPRQRRLGNAEHCDLTDRTHRQEHRLQAPRRLRHDHGHRRARRRPPAGSGRGQADPGPALGLDDSGLIDERLEPRGPRIRPRRQVQFTDRPEVMPLHGAVVQQRDHPLVGPTQAAKRHDTTVREKQRPRLPAARGPLPPHDPPHAVAPHEDHGVVGDGPIFSHSRRPGRRVTVSGDGQHGGPGRWMIHRIGGRQDRFPLDPLRVV